MVRGFSQARARRCVWLDYLRTAICGTGSFDFIYSVWATGSRSTDWVALGCLAIDAHQLVVGKPEMAGVYPHVHPGFSGCTFAGRVGGRNLFAVHPQPDRGLSGKNADPRGKAKGAYCTGDPSCQYGAARSDLIGWLAGCAVLPSALHPNSLVAVGPAGIDRTGRYDWADVGRYLRALPVINC